MKQHPPSFIRGYRRKNKKVCILIAFSFGLAAFHAGTASAQKENDWKPLAETYSIRDLQKIIMPADQWQPFPNFTHPEGFSAIPEKIRKDYIREGEALLNARWMPLPANVFLEFVRNGNRSDYEKLSFERRQQLAKLVLAEAFDKKGRFIDQVINGIWAICEESFWGVPAHLGLQKAGSGLPDMNDPVVDLFAAETAAEMGWTCYLLKPELDKVNPLVAARIKYEVNKRIFIPYLQHTDWGYLGFTWKANPVKNRRVNNWNPWINSNVLAAALLLAKDSVRMKLIYKTMASIDNFVIPYPADGGSDEGPEYWGRAAGSLLDYLELLKNASGGKINSFNQDVIRNMGRYSYQTYISYPYYINYGDADAIYKPDPALLYRFGSETHDSVLLHFAAFEAREQQFGSEVPEFSFGVLNRALPALFVINRIKDILPEAPLVRDVWLPDIQLMAARSKENSTDQFYVAVKGGNNGESHNHNDVGNLIVYYNGHPVLIDAGAQTYTAQTFSSRRYELWNNQSAFHNLPDVNGFMQQDGAAFTATDVHYWQDNNKASVKMNIASSYPRKAEVSSWVRTVTLNRGKDVRITEDYQLTKYLAPVTENFLTALAVDIRQPGVVLLTDPSRHKTFRLQYDRKLFTASVDPVTIDDGKAVGNAGEQITRTGRMYTNWGSTLYHIKLESVNQHLKQKFAIGIH